MGSRKFFIALGGTLGAGMLLFGGAGVAAPAAGGPDSVPTAYAARLTSADAAFQRVEAAATTVMAKRVLTRADLEGAGGLDDTYSKAMMAAFDTAVKDAQTASSSKGASGNVQGLRAFEDLAVRHESRLKGLAVQADGFQAKIRSGAVKVDPDVVKSWSAPERQEFMKSLEPSARAAYPIALLEGVDPRAPASPFAARDEAQAQLAFASIVMGSACSAVKPCVPPCVAKNWSACASCLASKAPGVYAYYNSTFMPRWNGAGKGKYTSLAIWRLGVLAAFVQVLA